MLTGVASARAALQDRRAEQKRLKGQAAARMTSLIDRGLMRQGSTSRHNGVDHRNTAGPLHYLAEVALRQQSDGETDGGGGG